MGNRRLATVRAPARSRVWFGFATNRITVPPLTSNSQVIVSSASWLLFGRPTIARIRGYLRVQVDQSQAPAGSQLQYAIGITTVVDTVAVGIPAPLTNPDVRWLWWHSGHLTAPGASGVESGDSKGETVVIDSKAMIKVPVGHDLVMVFEHFAVFEGVLPEYEASAAGRILVMPS